MGSCVLFHAARGVDRGIEVVLSSRLCSTVFGKGFQSRVRHFFRARELWGKSWMCPGPGAL